MPDLVKSNLKAGAVIAAFVVLIGWGWAINEKATAAEAAKARMEGRIETLQSTAGDHETRLRSMESGMAEMRADVKWIRQTMERETRQAAK